MNRLKECIDEVSNEVDVEETSRNFFFMDNKTTVSLYK